LNPDEIAQGIVALRNLNNFVFQAPICHLRPSDEFDFVIPARDTMLRLTSHYKDLTLVRMHPDLLGDMESKEYLWLEGSLKEHRYDVARSKIDLFLVSLMGMMNVLGLVRYTAWSRPGSSLSIGAGDRINSGAYIDMLSVRLSRHLIGMDFPVADNRIDSARSKHDLIAVNLRILCRAMTDPGSPASAVRQACRMFLRAYEVWNVGEAAMFLAITMEGLLLDKRQKEDLSARLQEAVAYWLGGSADERESNRKRVSELYRVRSNYVHNGEDAASSFDLESVREITRRVILKEIVTLESRSL
jgi:hypothetical protein